MNNFQNLLSPGTIKTIHSGNGTVSEPWVQFIFIKLVEREPNSGTSASGQRWKVALSDGINFIQGNSYCSCFIIRLDSCTCNNAIRAKDN